MGETTTPCFGRRVLTARSRIPHGVDFGISTDDPAAYFANVTLPAVEALLRERLGFTADDIAAAHRRARNASFAADAARIAAQLRREQQACCVLPTRPARDVLPWALLGVGGLRG